MSPSRPRPARPLLSLVIIAVAAVGWYLHGDLPELTGSSSSSVQVGTRLSPDRAQAALDQLDSLQVRGRAAMTGYSREAFFSGWTDVDDDGCNTRLDVIARDFTGTVTDCKLVSGSEVDPYTGKTITDPAKTDIDHVVALGNAWASGANRWDKAKRARLAQDMDNLLAVDASANRQKGDADAATWLPANKTFRCTYVARQVHIKADYDLSVTPAEHDAIADVLDECLDS